MIVGILIAFSIMSDCATSTIPYWEKTAYGTWEFSQAEVEILPIVSIHNIPSLLSESEVQKIQLFVKSRNQDGVAKVTRMAGQEDVFVQDARGKEVRLNFAQITEIQTIRYIRITPRQQTPGETAEEVGEAVELAPMIPVAIATLPFLSAMGLDAGENDEDKGKAALAYGGMSKNDLITYIGDPVERYHCEDKYGGHEVWIYRKGQVLRGGRVLFIGLADGKVYYTSYNTNFFKDSCSLLKATP